MNRQTAKQQLGLLLEQGQCLLREQQVDQLIDYVTLLDKWNKAYNLSSIRSVDKMITHHLMDSVMLAPWIQGDWVLDIGTGAGLPGIPLAIVCPKTRFYLVDSNGKKIRFLQHVVYQLGLSNVTPVQARVESLGTEQRFDVIMARAVSTLEVLLDCSEGLLAQRGRYVLQKGEYPEEELASLKRPARVEPLVVPGLDAQRHIVIIENEED